MVGRITPYHAQIAMTPKDYYQAACQKGSITHDAQQWMALEVFQQVYLNAMTEHSKRQGFFSFLHRPQLVKGIYLWGSVGIGKTFLMDCFYHSLPFTKKRRMHFHQFMQWIHQELTRHQGQADPLCFVAKDLAQQTEVLCFDEFYVSDITDAMLLGRLFKALFAEGVCLVATSNVPPKDLYKNGLQREQFLPAIDLLMTHTEVIHIPSNIDYRLRHLTEAGVFYTPLDEKAKQNMEKSFTVMTDGLVVDSDPIQILGRKIPVHKKADDIIWFDFADICHVPRSQNDYLEIAKKYHTVFISDIPVIPTNAKDQISLFVSLVDVFYDARIRLVISAAEPVQQLYHRGYMILEYARTNSRLLEMQSMEYFSGEFGKR